MTTIDELMARVAERAAQIDPELDRRLESAFLRAARQRMSPPAVEQLRSAVDAIEPSQAFSSTSIATSSRVPGGSGFHLAIAKVVNRQIEGLAHQGRQFGDQVRVALDAIVATFDEILEATRSDLVAEIDALYERVFVLEHQVRDLQVDGARLSDEQATTGADAAN